MSRSGDPRDHISYVINDLCVRLGKWDDDGERPAQIQFEMGNTFEDVVASHLARRFESDTPGRYVHGCELYKDGLYGNLDLLDTVDMAVEDVKLTKKSIRHEIDGDRYWHNWVQVMAYCHMIGAKIGRLHITYVMGNWKMPGQKGYNPPTGTPGTSTYYPGTSGWQYRCWENTFTDKELVDNWRMIVGHRRKLLQQAG